MLLRNTTDNQKLLGNNFIDNRFLAQVFQGDLRLLVPAVVGVSFTGQRQVNVTNN